MTGTEKLKPEVQGRRGGAWRGVGGAQASQSVENTWTLEDNGDHGGVGGV